MKKDNKAELLQTSMMDLPLGTSFKKCFDLTDDRDVPIYTNLRVPTLAEFIDLNPYLKYHTSDFRDFRKNHTLFNKRSKKWKLLKAFLINSGLTSEDWPMLVPQKMENSKMVDDFSRLSKAKILGMPIQVICPGKATRYMEKDTVAEVLNLEEGDYRRKQSTYFSIKQKLYSLGFRSGDGYLMRFKFPALTKTKLQHIKFLQENKSFSYKDAIQAVNFGLRAGWIK